MPMDIVGDERASSSQPPMSPGSTAQSASPNMGTPMSHFQPPYEPQTVPLPENNRAMQNSMEVRVFPEFCATIRYLSTFNQ
ncbi:hypothetical protein ANCCEY_11062 [Ancylostoma ceylanicum]|uniref:Uncharacterized protein n=1 Tax=Ancylostoma ceylanicum TaxID=53326 RepID=A0A0D6LCP1_9BILA|nr:hypothetical protein ANCCEY_11062 [Ancylostoma ceylanicum]